MNIDEISIYLNTKKKNYIDIESLSTLQGIYAIYFVGNIFPNKEIPIFKDQLIYIGKTKSNEVSRVLNTHFSSGKTGSSTLRKSIGSLLQEKFDLHPIPRNKTDYQNNNFSHFKFDKQSEKILTDWMKTNLALSFFEFSDKTNNLEDLETRLIEKNVPILNIQNNNQNIFKQRIQELRSRCAKIARETRYNNSNFRKS